MVKCVVRLLFMDYSFINAVSWVSTLHWMQKWWLLYLDISFLLLVSCTLVQVANSMVPEVGLLIGLLGKLASSSFLLGWDLSCCLLCISCINWNHNSDFFMAWFIFLVNKWIVFHFNKLSIELQDKPSQSKKESLMCHQCQRSDKSVVICCSNCNRKRYCYECLEKW